MLNTNGILLDNGKRALIKSSSSRDLIFSVEKEKYILEIKEIETVKITQDYTFDCKNEKNTFLRSMTGFFLGGTVGAFLGGISAIIPNKVEISHLFTFYDKNKNEINIILKDNEANKMLNFLQKNSVEINLF